MKRFLLRTVLALAAICSGSLAHAQMFNHLGAGVGVGTNGISIDVATPVTRWLNVRAGIDIMPGITFNANADYNYWTATEERYGTIDLKGDLGRVQGHFIVNFYPVPKTSLYVAAGAYFGGSKLLKISGHSDELGEYSDNGYAVIGNYEIPVDENGNLSGGLKVNGFRPYLGIGWGRAVPGKLLNFGVELGVQFQSKPKVYTDYGELDETLVEDDNTFEKIRSALSVYPVLSFKLNFRAF